MEKPPAPLPPPPEPERRSDIQVRGSMTRCPFCHTDVVLDSSWVVCAECLARHHADCWSESPACGSCGATEGLARKAREAAPEEHKAQEQPPRAEGPVSVSQPAPADPLFGSRSTTQLTSEFEVDPDRVLMELNGSSSVGFTSAMLGLPAAGLVLAWILDSVGVGGDGLTIALVLGSFALFVLGGFAAVSASMLSGTRTLLTETGVVRQQSGGTLHVPWENLRAYSVHRGYIALLGEAGARICAPTPTAEDREQAIALLERRGIRTVPGLARE